MVLIRGEDIVGFLCILLLTPLFIVWFSNYKASNPYIHKLLVSGLPISLSFLIRRMIINRSREYEYI